ncbi:caseinolytic peptidase B protein homolog, partial [Stegodyphus dumicola]|uniref:caseinolytic peptidase B protein homolog n=1 Tax=Stegodyphus dumicola TaxID=202533 RepID=UPI0015B37A23
MNGNLKVVETLLELGADVNLGDEFSNVYQVAKDKRVHSLEVWATREDEFSEKLNMRATFRNTTALHYAVLADEIKVVEILLNHGADPSKVNDIGHKPIDYANSKEMKQLLETATTK